MFFLPIAIGMSFIFHTPLYSQSCLPDGITFSTQQQIDNFQIDYPGCSEIEGSVIINGNDITNFVNFLAFIEWEKVLPNLPMNKKGISFLEFINDE